MDKGSKGLTPVPVKREDTNLRGHVAYNAPNPHNPGAHNGRPSSRSSLDGINTQHRQDSRAGAQQQATNITSRPPFNSDRTEPRRPSESGPTQPLATQPSVSGASVKLVSISAPRVSDGSNVARVFGRSLGRAQSTSTPAPTKAAISTSQSVPLPPSNRTGAQAVAYAAPVNNTTNVPYPNPAQGSLPDFSQPTVMKQEVELPASPPYSPVSDAAFGSDDQDQADDATTAQAAQLDDRSTPAQNFQNSDRNEHTDVGQRPQRKDKNHAAVAAQFSHMFLPNAGSKSAGQHHVGSGAGNAASLHPVRTVNPVPGRMKTLLNRPDAVVAPADPCSAANTAQQGGNDAAAGNVRPRPELESRHSDVLSPAPSAPVAAAPSQGNNQQRQQQQAQQQYQIHQSNLPPQQSRPAVNDDLEIIILEEQNVSNPGARTQAAAGQQQKSKQTARQQVQQQHAFAAQQPQQQSWSHQQPQQPGADLLRSYESADQEQLMFMQRQWQLTQQQQQQQQGEKVTIMMLSDDDDDEIIMEEKPAPQAAAQPQPQQHQHQHPVMQQMPAPYGLHPGFPGGMAAGGGFMQQNGMMQPYQMTVSQTQTVTYMTVPVAHTPQGMVMLNPMQMPGAQAQLQQPPAQNWYAPAQPQQQLWYFQAHQQQQTMYPQTWQQPQQQPPYHPSYPVPAVPGQAGQVQNHAIMPYGTASALPGTMYTEAPLQQPSQFQPPPQHLQQQAQAQVHSQQPTQAQQPQAEARQPVPASMQRSVNPAQQQPTSPTGQQQRPQQPTESNGQAADQQVSPAEPGQRNGDCANQRCQDNGNAHDDIVGNAVGDDDDDHDMTRDVHEPQGPHAVGDSATHADALILHPDAQADPQAMASNSNESETVTAPATTTAGINTDDAQKDGQPNKKSASKRKGRAATGGKQGSSGKVYVYGPIVQEVAVQPYTKPRTQRQAAVQAAEKLAQQIQAINNPGHVIATATDERGHTRQFVRPILPPGNDGTLEDDPLVYQPFNPGGKPRGGCSKRPGRLCLEAANQSSRAGKAGSVQTETQSGPSRKHKSTEDDDDDHDDHGHRQREVIQQPQKRKRCVRHNKTYSDEDGDLHALANIQDDYVGTAGAAAGSARTAQDHNTTAGVLSALPFNSRGDPVVPAIPSMLGGGLNPVNSNQPRVIDIKPDPVEAEQYRRGLRVGLEDPNNRVTAGGDAVHPGAPNPNPASPEGQQPQQQQQHPNGVNHHPPQGPAIKSEPTPGNVGMLQQQGQLAPQAEELVRRISECIATLRTFNAAPLDTTSAVQRVRALTPKQVTDGLMVCEACIQQLLDQLPPPWEDPSKHDPSIVKTNIEQVQGLLKSILNLSSADL